MPTPNAGADSVAIRLHGKAHQLTLIYLPGLHGDWTLVGGFRAEARCFTRFAEFTYPQTTEWSLADYATAIQAALLDHGICRGWLLAESFGSQVAWALLARQMPDTQPSRTQASPTKFANAPAFKAEGLILAGGFVRHP